MLKSIKALVLVAATCSVNLYAFECVECEANTCEYSSLETEVKNAKTAKDLCKVMNQALVCGLPPKDAMNLLAIAMKTMSPEEFNQYMNTPLSKDCSAF